MDTTKNYETMSTQELRTEARTRPALVGAWIASATKGMLIDALKANDVGQPFDRPVRGPQQQSLPTPPATNDGLTPEARILAALKEMIPATGAPSEELAAVAERVGNVERGLVNDAERISALESAARPREITVILPDGQKHDVGVQHKQFDRLLVLLSQRVNVYLVGPAGSGKTHAGESCARALAIPFYAASFGKQTPQSQIFGFIDATGTYRRSLFREAYENGGVFLADEIDAANDNTITSINAATANQVCGFPDGMVKKHPDFIMIAAGNTYGRGADRQYVGRTQLDAATLDRFAVINWDYDEALERAITSNVEWTARVQELRANAQRNGVRVVISPRASIAGEKLLAAGVPQDDVEEMLIFKGIDKATREKIEGHC